MGIFDFLDFLAGGGCGGCSVSNWKAVGGKVGSILVGVENISGGIWMEAKEAGEKSWYCWRKLGRFGVPGMICGVESGVFCGVEEAESEGSAPKAAEGTRRVGWVEDEDVDVDEAVGLVEIVT